MNPLTENQARNIVEQYVANEQQATSTQEILDSGAISSLKRYEVRPGKVSDCISGGKSSYLDKETGEIIDFENPNLNTKESVPLYLMVRTSRISTHDYNRGTIPFKDQILAKNHHFMLGLIEHALGNSQYDINLGDNSVVIVAEKLRELDFENVLRAYMAKSSTSTSLYQHFLNGKRKFCGHHLPNDLIPNGPLPYVMDTPSTKSDEHDLSVTPEFLFEKGIATPAQYKEVRNNSIFAFGIVDNFLRQRGLLAVDTKTEHGIDHQGKIKVKDEVWTMDSSRFWMLDDYQQQLDQLKSGDIVELNPQSFSKEFARGFSRGKEEYTNDQRIEISVRYIMGIQHLTGERFEPDFRSRDEQVVTGLQKVVDELVG
jgi:phosphoribosylaminoimidazole-succinocarboxamide synthase